MTFFSRLAQVTESNLKEAFQTVIKDKKQSVYIAAGKIGSLEFGALKVNVYGTENSWKAQVMLGQRIVAANQYTNKDI